MGAIVEAMAAYARPLLDATDGSFEQVQRAFTYAQLCWNLALYPEERRDESIRKHVLACLLAFDAQGGLQRAAIQMNGRSSSAQYT